MNVFTIISLIIFGVCVIYTIGLLIYGAIKGRIARKFAKKEVLDEYKETNNED